MGSGGGEPSPGRLLSSGICPAGDGLEDCLKYSDSLSLMLPRKVGASTSGRGVRGVSPAMRHISGAEGSARER